MKQHKKKEQNKNQEESKEILEIKRLPDFPLYLMNKILNSLKL